MSNELRLKKFVKAIFKASDFGTADFGDLDALTLESLAVENGIARVDVRHQPCDKECCVCAEIFTGNNWEDGVECIKLEDWFTAETPAEYIRPNITQKMKYDAEKSARELITKYGFNNINKIVGALAVENMRLVAEINEHRAARGIDPLPVFEV